MSREFQPETYFTVTCQDTNAATVETPMRSFETLGDAERHIERARNMDESAGTRWFKYGIFKVTTTRIREPEL